MVYEVKVKFKLPFMAVNGDFKDRVNSVYINEDSEMLMLFKEDSNKSDVPHKTVRYAIPLNVIETLEINPIYENNRQTIFGC